jgi:hypothetical protein
LSTALAWASTHSVEHAEVAVDGVLHGQGGDGRSRMAALGEQGFDICLQAGATTWVVAGETEDNGARAVDIHGARAYHQTFFADVWPLICMMAMRLHRDVSYAKVSPHY